jgi:peptide/nickel transport system substrate-binding protein
VNPLGTQGILRLNHLQPPFNNPSARRAVQWLISQDDYLSVMFSDRSVTQICGAFLVCGTPWASEAGAEALLSKLPEDQRIAKGKALLAEAGYKGEPVVILDPTDRVTFHRAALVLAQALRKGGMTVQVDAMDWGTMVQRRGKKDPPGQGGWSAFHTSSGGFEASNPAFHIADSAGCDKAWFGWPCDQKVEDLRAAWARAPNLDERKRVSVEFQKRAMEDVVYIPYGQWSTPIAYRKNLTGIIGVPDSYIFWNVDKQ